MAQQVWTELPLFEMAAETPRASKTQAQLARELRPAWRELRNDRRSCDQCVRDLHAAGGRGPLPLAAKFMRTVVATGDKMLLCRTHGEPLKAADEALRGRK